MDGRDTDPKSGKGFIEELSAHCEKSAGKIDVYKRQLLNDSKQLTEKQRYALREVIEKEAIAWAVGIVSPEEIVSQFIFGW